MVTGLVTENFATHCMSRIRLYFLRRFLFYSERESTHNWEKAPKGSDIRANTTSRSGTGVCGFLVEIGPRVRHSRSQMETFRSEWRHCFGNRLQLASTQALARGYHSWFPKVVVEHVTISGHLRQQPLDGKTLPPEDAAGVITQRQRRGPLDDTLYF
ncbi:MAG: hypothetical protein ABL985_06085 [Casimicrobium sp.]|jgi:hypothetical protein